MAAPALDDVGAPRAAVEDVAAQPAKEAPHFFTGFGAYWMQ